MKAEQFIKASIDNLISKFPYIKCRYDYDQYAEAYFVEMSPKTAYNMNAEMAHDMAAITMEAEEEFDIDLCFTTEEYTEEFKDNAYVRQGHMYDIYLDSLDNNFADLGVLEGFTPTIVGSTRKAKKIAIPRTFVPNRQKAKEEEETYNNSLALAA